MSLKGTIISSLTIKRMRTVPEVLAKTSWDQDDISFLVSQKDTLPVSVLERMGLAPSTLVVEEPVTTEAVSPSEPTQVVETPKKRGRPSKK